jgi:hypothetical protein
MTVQFRVSVPILVLAITAALVGSALAQPRNPPPKRFKAEAAAQMLGGLTLITIKKQAASPADIVKSIADQAGMTVDYDLTAELQNHEPISVNYDQQAFWVVLRSLSSALKLNIGVGPSSPPGDGETGSSLMKTEQSLDGPAYQSGPCLIVVNELSRSALLNSNGQAIAEQRLTIDFLALFDPEVKVRNGNPMGRQIEFAGENRAALKQLGPEWNWVQQAKRLSPLVWSVTAGAQLPAAKIRQLDKLTGELSGFVTTLATEKWTIDNVLKAKTQQKSVGGADFYFRGLTKSATLCTLQVASDGLGEESDFGWPPRTSDDQVMSLRLLDDKGHRLRPESWKFESGQIEVRFRLLQTDGDPQKLIWELPAKVGDIEVPFEFTNLPLP